MSDTRDGAVGPELRWSPVRVAGTVVLGAWAVLFWFLLASGRDAFYLSTRTEWVVPVAAVLLSLATFGRLASARAAQTEPLRSRELGVMIAMVVPVLLITILPPATLGSFSAGKRSAVAGAGFSASAGDIATGDLTLVDVATAQTTPEGERALARRAGEQVDIRRFRHAVPGHARRRVPADAIRRELLRRGRNGCSGSGCERDSGRASRTTSGSRSPARSIRSGAR